MTPFGNAVLIKLFVLILLHVCKADGSARDKRCAQGCKINKEPGGLLNDLEETILKDAFQDKKITNELTSLTKRSYQPISHARHRRHQTYKYLIKDDENVGLLNSMGGSILDVRIANPEIANTNSEVPSNRFNRAFHSTKYKRFAPNYWGYLRKAAASVAGVASETPTYTANAESNNTSTKFYHGYRSMRLRRHHLNYTDARNRRSLPFYKYYMRKKETKQNTGVLEAQDGQIISATAGNPDVANVEKTERKKKYLQNYYGFRNKRSPLFYGHYLRKKADKENTGVLDAQDGQIVKGEALNSKVGNVDKDATKNKFFQNYYGFRNKRAPPFYGHYLRKKADKENTGVLDAQDGQTVDANVGNSKVGNVDKDATKNKYLQMYYGFRNKRTPLFYSHYLRKKADKGNTGVLDAQEGQNVKGEAGNSKVANVDKVATKNKLFQNYYGFRNKRSVPFYGHYLRKKADKENTGILDAQDGQIVKGELLNPRLANVKDTETENRYLHGFYRFRNKRSLPFYGYYMRKKEEKENTGLLDAQDGQIIRATAGNGKLGNVKETNSDNRFFQGQQAHGI